MLIKKTSMGQTKTILLLLVIMNAIVVREAYIWRQELYWLLLLTVPALGFTIATVKSKNN